ncbi:MAG: response regulator [Nanoarchaeota archaeon]|nr:response regulator [Nanoarchaeota archaeon]
MKKKILVIDDDAEICCLMKDVLTTAGYAVETSCSGKEGVKMALKNGFKAVLLDVMMPEMSGQETLELLRKKGSKIPIVYVTVKPKEEVDLKHTSGFVQKPFKNMDLLKVVESVS